MNLRKLVDILTDRRGVALPMALLALLVLSVLIIGFSVLSASEPTIANNQLMVVRARAIAEHIAEAPEVYWVGVTTGTRNLHVGAVFRSNKELVDFMSGWLCKVKGIIATTTTSILELTKRKWTIGVPEDMVGKGPHGSRRRLTRKGRR